MRRACRTLALATATAATLGGAPALSAVSDPDDVGGKLDLKTLRATQREGTFPQLERNLRVSLSTYGAWSMADVPPVGLPYRSASAASSSRNRLVVLIDTNGNESADYKARIVWANTRDGGRVLVARLVGHGDRAGEFFAPIPVTKTGNRVVFRINLANTPLEPSVSNVRVAARSVYEGGACRTVCVDRAPNAGFTKPAHL